MKVYERDDEPTVATGRTWTCDVCSRPSTWDQEWQWYGSDRAIERCGHRVTTCSAECRADPRVAQLVDQWRGDHRYGRCRATEGV